MEWKKVSKNDIKPGTVVVMRIDANVPIKNGKVAAGGAHRVQVLGEDVTRYRKWGAKLVLATHLGSPEKEGKEATSTKIIQSCIEKEIGAKVQFINDVVGEVTVAAIQKMKNGEVLLLQNLRHEWGEEANSAQFAKQLAQLGDVYVNNAFGVLHRKHASVHAIAKYITVHAGEIVRTEVKELSKKFTKPAAVILGGIKLETKIPLMQKLADQTDVFLLGGGVGAVCVSAERNIQLSLANGPIEAKEIARAKKFLKKYKEKVLLPVDFIVKTTQGKHKAISAESLAKDDQVCDIGPKTIEVFEKLLKGKKTIFWNGTMGYAEEKRTQSGTKKVADLVRRSGAKRRIIGGGDTVAFLEKIKKLDTGSYISTGGGAMLAFVAGERMPGLEVIK